MTLANACTVLDFKLLPMATAFFSRLKYLNNDWMSCSDIHGLQRMHHNDFGDGLSFTCLFTAPAAS